MFKKSKAILLVLISLAFISMFLYFIFTFIVKKNDVVLVNEIKEYNYICKSTATSLYKEKFNEYDYSLIYKVDKNCRVSTMITDRKEKRLYCGLSCMSHIDMQEFLERKLKNIKNA